MSGVLGGLVLLEDLAKEIGVSRATLQRWTRLNQFPHLKYPGKRRVLVPRAWADAYLAGNCELEVKKLANGGRSCRPKGAR